MSFKKEIGKNACPKKHLALERFLVFDLTFLILSFGLKNVESMNKIVQIFLLKLDQRACFFSDPWWL